jgi:hypothetical protein
MTKERKPLDGAAAHRAYARADSRLARDRRLSPRERTLARQYFRELFTLLCGAPVNPTHLH